MNSLTLESFGQSTADIIDARDLKTPSEGADVATAVQVLANHVNRTTELYKQSAKTSLAILSALASTGEGMKLIIEENARLKAKTETLEGRVNESERANEAQIKVLKELMETVKATLLASMETMKADLTKKITDLEAQQKTLQERFNKHGHQYYLWEGGCNIYGNRNTSNHVTGVPTS